MNSLLTSYRVELFQRIRKKFYVLVVRPRLNPKQAPIAFVLVEQIENYLHDSDELGSSINSATIDLRFNTIFPANFPNRVSSGHFSGSYAQSAVTGIKLVSLTSPSINIPGSVFNDLIELKGHRIGTFLFNEIVSWSLQWPDASIKKIKLSDHQADETNKVRRNRFYEQFGLCFDYVDQDQRSGSLKSMQVNALNTVLHWQNNIQLKSIRQFVNEILFVKDLATAELVILETQLTELKSELRFAESNPFTWALNQYWITNDSSGKTTVKTHSSSDVRDNDTTDGFCAEILTSGLPTAINWEDAVEEQPLADLLPQMLENRDYTVSEIQSKNNHIQSLTFILSNAKINSLKWAFSQYFNTWGPFLGWLAVLTLLMLSLGISILK